MIERSESLELNSQCGQASRRRNQPPAVLGLVLFFSGSARTQGGGPPAPAVDGGILALGALLVATLVASLYASYRVSTVLTRRAVAQA